MDGCGYPAASLIRTLDQVSPVRIQDPQPLRYPDNGRANGVSGESKEACAAADFANVRVKVFDSIEGFYNRQRRHFTLGYLSLVEYERWWYNQPTLAMLCPVA